MPLHYPIPLSSLNPAETVLNRKGRRRLHEGVLEPGARTSLVSPGIEKNLDFACRMQMGLLPACKRLVEVFKACDGAAKHLNQSDEAYWDNRCIYPHELQDDYPDAAETIRRVVDNTIRVIGETYDLEGRPLYCTTVNMVKWEAGQFMPPHADNANPDNAPHQYPYRAFGSILYLNDDYHGGELFFTRLDKIIKPKTGMLVAFSGGFHHEHAVLKVTKGTRYTLASFYTFEEEYKDRFLYRSSARA